MGFITVLAFAVFAFLLRSLIPRRKPSTLPLPPGPPGYPIIGCTDIPTKKPWLTYAEWAKVYGNIMYFEFLGQPFLILSSAERISDIFDKRSSKYSSRVPMPMIRDLMGWTFNFAFQPYGLFWRRHRRLFHEHFNIGVVDRYLDIHTDETNMLLARMLDSPQDYVWNLRRMFGGTIMRITYGAKVTTTNDVVLRAAEEALRGLNVAFNPGTFWVDFLPAMKYIPSWFPGAYFQRFADHQRHLNDVVVEKPFAEVQERLKAGTAQPSVAASLIEKLPSDKEGDEYDKEELIAKNVSAVAYVGGADTTVSAVQTFLLAMVMHPECQANARAELDAVVGTRRLPTFEDRPLLPYIDAVMKESMRWQPVTNLAVPHCTVEDDEYDGYFIPKGTIVMGNAWMLLHDPVVYPDPEAFKPERWLKNGKLDPSVPGPETAAFGFGRRICPGRHLSNNSMFSLVASLLSTFDITQAKDENGVPISVGVDMSDGLLSAPLPFPCDIKPRSQDAVSLIRDAVEESL